MMRPPAGMPLHMMPVPRPKPPGVTYQRGDVPYIIWIVVFGLLAIFAGWYGFGYARHDDEQVGGALAMVGFLVLAGLVSLPWIFEMKRRKRLLVLGRAVPGTVVNRTQVTVRMQYGGVIGGYYRYLVAFEDKQVTLSPLGAAFPATAPIFVDGPWAGYYDAPHLIMAKWSPRMGR